MISAITLETPLNADHVGREAMLAFGEQVRDDVGTAIGEAPMAIIAFGTEAVTGYSPPYGDHDASWIEFAPKVIELCRARSDIYGIVLVRPYGMASHIYTAHFDDGQGVVDHGFGVVRERRYTYVPQTELC